MKTVYLTWNDTKEIAKRLKAGEIVVFPTETVYGIACIPTQECKDKLANAKGRPEDKPFTLMCSSLTQVAIHCQTNMYTAATCQRFMPGEVTFLLPARKGIDPSIDLGTGIVGVRIPDYPQVCGLIEEIGHPILVSSANLSGERPATSFEEAKAAFDGRVDVIVEAPCNGSTPSTIVDFVHLEKGLPKLVRQGAVAFEDITHMYRFAYAMIAVGSDHGGFAYKQAIAAHLRDSGYSVMECGCDSESSVDYPIYGKSVAKAVAAGVADFGVVVCTSGEGISIAANKVPGIRCGIAYDDVVTGKMREHNNANVIAFGQKYMALEDVLRRVDIFLIENFSSEAKHQRRVGELEED